MEDYVQSQMKHTAPAPGWLASTTQGFAEALRYKGATTRGTSLGRWLAITAALAVGFGLLSPRVPGLLLVVPGLLLAVLVPAGLELRDQIRSQASGSKLLERLEMPAAMLALAGIIALTLRTRLFDGIVLDTGDHQLMLQRSHRIAEVLARGHLLKWTLAMQGGEPITDLYPFIFDLLAAPLYWLFTGPQGEHKAYIAAVLLLWWLRGVAGYYLARRFAPPLPAMLVAAASLFDLGNAWDGTWTAVLFWGMVHSNLSISLCGFAIALQIDVARTGSALRLVLAAAVGGLGLLAHPVGLAFVGVCTAALLLFAWSGDRRPRHAVSAGLAGVLALALAASWLLPYWHALRHHGYVTKEPGVLYWDAAQGLLDGTVPGSAYPAFAGLVVLAVLIALTAADRLLAAIAFSALGLWTLTLSPLAISSGFADMFTQYLDGQPRRFNHGVKLAVLPPLAWLLHRGYGLLREPRSLEVRAVLGRSLVATVLAAGFLRVVANMGQRLESGVRAQLPQAVPDRVRTYAGPEHEAVFAWLRTQRQRDTNPTPWRVLVKHVDMDRRAPHGAWAEGFTSGIPIVDLRFMSTAFNRHRPRESTANALREWDIRYTLSDNPQPPVPTAHRAFQSGALSLWETPGYDGRYIVAPPGIGVTDVSVTDERIVFRVTGAPSTGVDVRIRSAWFPSWRATSQGRPVRVEPQAPFPGAKGAQEQLLVKGVTDGVVTLTCDAPLPRSRLGSTASIVGVLLLGLLGPRRSRTRIQRHFDGIREALVRHSEQRLPRSRYWLAAVALLLLMGCGVVWWRGSARVRYPAVEGIGMSVTEYAAGQRRSCQPEWWLGRYTCHSAAIRGWFGYDDTKDESGESTRRWSAIHVTATAPEAKLRLEFPRLALRGSQLELTLQSNAGFSLAVFAGKTELRLPKADEGKRPHPTPPTTAKAATPGARPALQSYPAGKQVLRIPVPARARGKTTLALDVALSVQQATLMFAGGSL